MDVYFRLQTTGYRLCPWWLILNYTQILKPPSAASGIKSDFLTIHWTLTQGFQIYLCKKSFVFKRFLPLWSYLCQRENNYIGSERAQVWYQHSPEPQHWGQPINVEFVSLRQDQLMYLLPSGCCTIESAQIWSKHLTSRSRVFSTSPQRSQHLTTGVTVSGWEWKSLMYC